MRRARAKEAAIQAALSLPEVPNLVLSDHRLKGNLGHRPAAPPPPSGWRGRGWTWTRRRPPSPTPSILPVNPCQLHKGEKGISRLALVVFDWGEESLFDSPPGKRGRFAPFLPLSFRKSGQKLRLKSAAFDSPDQVVPSASPTAPLLSWLFLQCLREILGQEGLALDSSERSQLLFSSQSAPSIKAFARLADQQ